MTVRARTLAFILAGVLAVPAFAADAVPKQFSTPEAMADALGDFSAETGAFKVDKPNPLTIRLTIPDPGKNPDQQLVAADMLRAFQWGVWRTFLHTDAQQVTVSVVSPVAVDGNKILGGTVTRARALQVAQEMLGVSELAELITPRQTWSDAMKRCRFNDTGQPGLRNCTLALTGQKLK